MTDPYADAPETPPLVTNTVEQNASDHQPDTTPALIPDVNGFNDQTLMKVRAGLRQMLGSEQVITDCIAEMQNQNLLFREPIEGKGGASDGYHTFDELYEHRRALTSVLATIASINADSWRSKAHHPDDSPIHDGYFIVGIELPDGPITYHYPLSDWDKFDLVDELPHAMKWDGADPTVTPARLDAFAAHLRAAILEGREVRQDARDAVDEVLADGEEQG